MSKPAFQLIPLAQCPAAIRAATGARVSYRRVYSAILDGEVKSTRINGRHYLDARDFPKIAEALGSSPVAA